MINEIPFDEPIPIELFKLKRKIRCLPLLEARIPDKTIQVLKKKRRDIKRAAKRLVRRK